MIENQNPLEKAEELFTQCVLMVRDISDLDERVKKFEESKKSAKLLIEMNLKYWLEVEREFATILDITKMGVNALQDDN
jgi:hypothetical protein